MLNFSEISQKKKKMKVGKGMNEVNFQGGTFRDGFEIKDFPLSQYPHLKGSDFAGRSISVAVLFHPLPKTSGSLSSD